MPTLTRIHRPLSSVALTVSGNETADTFGVSRFTNTQGDGLTFPNKSVGVWPAATNLNDNGNATTNTTGITDHSSTTTRVTSGVVKFGSTAFNVVSSNLTANEGPSQAINGGLGNTQYTISAWVWLISGAATVRATLSDSVAGKQGGTPVALTATPQRVTVTATTGVAGITEASYIETTVQQAGTWRIGGWQVETGPIATPYVQTDGADATRSAAAVSAAVAGIATARAGYAVVYLSAGFPATDSAATHGVWGWITDVNNRLLLYHGTTGVWAFRRDAGGVGTQVTIASTHVVDGLVCVYCTWSSSAVKVGFGGSAFTSGADTNIPTMTATAMQFGSPAGVALGALAVRWAVVGKGTLTDADAAWFNTIAVGGGVPDLYECPGNATLVWDGRNAVAQVRG